MIKANTANNEIKLLLHLYGIYAYELVDELGICQSTYSTRMRKPLSVEDKTKFIVAINAIAERKNKGAIQC